MPTATRDTLLVQVHQEGVACHTGARTCFFTRLSGGDAPAADGAGPAMLEVARARAPIAQVAAPPPGSYVAGLLAKGEAQICRKIGEEAIEVVTAALGGEGDERVVAEIADLWFHTHGAARPPRASRSARLCFAASCARRQRSADPAGADRVDPMSARAGRPCAVRLPWPRVALLAGCAHGGRPDRGRDVLLGRRAIA